VHRLRVIATRLGGLVRRPPRWLILTVLAVGIATTYLFIISAGTWTTWPTWNAGYDLMAEGFRAGHLYTVLRPAPQLLMARNPLDFVYSNYWVWDASIHKGHIYLCWGPLPGVILAGIKSLFGIRFEVGDQYFVGPFFAIQLVAGMLLIDRMARRLFPEMPFALVVLGVLVFGFGNPTPFIVATPGMYQAAIIGGQAFMLLGMVFAADAVWASTSGRPARRLLLAAGCFWGLAIATRVTVGPPIALIILLTAFSIARPGPRRAAWLERGRALAWMGLPVGAFAVALLFYNRARFDSFFEFGVNLQMSTLRFRTAASYLFPNLYSYLLRPMVSSCQFPFVMAPFGLGRQAFPAGFHVPSCYLIDEPVAGMLLAAPWSWFAGVGLVMAARGVWRQWKVRTPIVELDARARTNAWLPTVFVIIGTVTGLPVVALFLATMRYMIDVSSGICLFALWGAWSLYDAVRVRPWPRRAVTAAIVLFSAATIVIGLLLGVTGYNQMFRLHNPGLYSRMVRAFSLCS